MIVLARGEASVTVAASPQASAIIRLVSATTPGELAIDIDSVAAQTMPAAARSQLVSFEVWFGNTQVPERDVLSLAVTEDLEQMASWELSLPIRSEWPVARSNPWGDPSATHAPLPSLARVSIFGVYVTSRARHRIPLLTDGLPQSTARQAGLDQLTGVDALGAYDRRTLDYDLPPGHGLDAGTVIRRMLVALGVPASQLSIPFLGRRMYKPVSVHGPGLATIQEIARAHGRAVRADRHGQITLERFHLPAAPVRWAFTDDDVLGSFVPPEGDVPTRLTLTTTRQILRPECGLRTERRVTTVFQDRVLRKSKYRQTAGGTLSIHSTSPPATVDISEVIVTETDYECDTVVGERIYRYTWFRRRAARYRTDSGGDPAGPIPISSTYPVVYVDDGAVAGDQAQAYMDPAEGWGLYDYQESARLYGPLSEGDTKAFLLGVVSRHFAYANAPAAVKSRATGSTSAWDAVAYLSGIYLTADGQGVNGITEVFQEVERTVEVPRPIPQGFLVGNDTDSYTLALSLGSEDGISVYLYADGSNGGGPAHRLQISEKIAEVYEGTGEASSRHYTTATKLLTTEKPRTVVEDVPSYLPRAEIREDVEPPESLFETEEEAEAAQAASRYENQPLEHTEIHETLERERQPHPITGSAPWAEDEAHLAAIARQELLEGATGTASVTMPINFLLQPGDGCAWTSRALALSLTGVVTTPRHAFPGVGQMATTQATIKVYVP